MPTHKKAHANYTHARPSICYPARCMELDAIHPSRPTAIEYIQFAAIRISYLQCRECAAKSSQYNTTFSAFTTHRSFVLSLFSLARSFFPFFTERNGNNYRKYCDEVYLDRLRIILLIDRNASCAHILCVSGGLFFAQRSCPIIDLTMLMVFALWNAFMHTYACAGNCILRAITASLYQFLLLLLFIGIIRAQCASLKSLANAQNERNTHKKEHRV